TNQSSFESFMGLLPGGFLDTGREYEYEGDFSMKGYVRGKAGAGQAPKVHMDYLVRNGAFHYVGYDSRLTDVQMKGGLHLDPADDENSWFKVEDFRTKLRDKPLSGHFAWQRFQDPRLAMELKGDIGLQDIRDFYPAFADSTRLEGDVNVDLHVEGRIADFEQRKYRAIKAMGNLRFADIRIADPRLDYPFENLRGDIAVNNHIVQVNKFSGKVSHSDFDINGTVTEYLPYIFEENGKIRGKVELRSQRMDLNEWLITEAPEVKDPLPGQEEETEQFAFRLPEHMDFEIRTDVGHFELAKLDARNVQGSCHLHDQVLKLHGLRMDACDGAMVMSGMLRVVNRDLMKVKIDANILDVDINQSFKTFDQLAAFALVEKNLYGRFSGDVHVTGDLNQFMELDGNSLYSYGSVSLKNGKLVDFEPLEGLAGFIKLEELRHIEFSDVNTGFRIEEGYFYIPKMALTANRFGLEVSGRHGFDNSLDYRVAVELPRKEARRAGNKDVLALVDM
ncbi:MAG: AsmA-like C-terminal region-containing protein, partial [Bacteroidota bacterium]